MTGIFPRHRFRWFLFRFSIWCVLGAGACEPGGPIGEDSSVRDSLGIEIVSNPGDVSLAGIPEWVASEEVSIGQVEGPSEYTFHRIREASVGPSGAVFVLDGGDQVVKVYDQSGEFRFRLGGEGDGPGEFRNASDLFWLADTLVVFDFGLRRFSHFSATGGFLETRPYALPPFEFGIPNSWHPIPGGFLALFGGGCRLPAPEDRRPFWKVLATDTEGLVIDTVMVRVARDVLAIYGDRFCTAAQMIGAPHHSIAVQPNGLAAYGDGRDYDIRVFQVSLESGEQLSGVPPIPIRIIRRSLNATPLGSDEISDFKERYRFNPDGSPVDRERWEAIETAWDTLGFPDSHRFFDALLWDDEERLWVRRQGWQEGKPDIWDLFDSAGLLIGEVSVPRGLEVASVNGGMIWGTVQDELGLTYVKGFRMDRRAERPGGE